VDHLTEGRSLVSIDAETVNMAFFVQFFFGIARATRERYFINAGYGNCPCRSLKDCEATEDFSLRWSDRRAMMPL
jgi:hypothetical protein